MSVRDAADAVPPATGSIERFSRGLAARVLRGGRRPERTMIRSSDLQSVLIILPYAIGDYIVATPLFEWLHQAAPQSRIDIAVSPITKELADRDPRFDRVGVVSIHGTDADMTAQMASFVGHTSYQVVFAPSVHNMTRAMRLARTVHGSPIMVGSEQQRRNDVYRQFFDHLIPHYYPLRHWCESYAVAGPLVLEHTEKIDPSPGLPWIKRPTGLFSPKRVILNISGKEAKKTLRTDMAIDVIKQIRARTRMTVDVIGAPNEAARVHEVVALVADEGVAPFEGDLAEVASHLVSAAAVVTPDTSIVHISSALGIPVVALYPEAHTVVEWGPYRVPFRAIISPDPTSVSAIPASTVVRALIDLLSTIEVRE